MRKPQLRHSSLNEFLSAMLSISCEAGELISGPWFDMANPNPKPYSNMKKSRLA